MAIKSHLVASTVAHLSVHTARPVHIVEVILDTKAVNMAQNDKALLFYVPPRHRLVNLRAEVLTVEGAASTMDVGPYSDAGTTAVDADGLLDGLNVNALTHANSVTAGADLAAKGVATAATGQYICALAVDALDAAVIKFQAEMIPYNG